MPQVIFPKAVLFDFDGTLADSYGAITASVNHVRSIHGMAPLAEPEVRCHVGRGPEHLLRHTVPGCEPGSAYVVYRSHHPSVLISGTQLLPGARELVRSLHNAGCRLAICSNKPRLYTQRLLNHFGWESVIEVVVGPEDVARSKPAPDMIFKALHQLSVAPGESLYIGDMAVDIEAARAAGVPVWVVPTGSDSVDALAKAQPDKIIGSLSDALDILDLR